MKLSLFTGTFYGPGTAQDFMDFYHAMNMPYLASDLLTKGFLTNQISAAVAAAINVANASGIDVRKHFKPVFSSTSQGIVKDCKLSRLGYGLVIMNADSSISAVSKFQVEVLQGFLNVT